MLLLSQYATPLNPAKHPSLLKWKSLGCFYAFVDGLPEDTFFYNRAKGMLSDGLGVHCKHHAFSLAEHSVALEYLTTKAKDAGMIVRHIRGNRVFTRIYND